MHNNYVQDHCILASNALEGVRKKLLDLTARNRLLNFRETAQTVRIINELSDSIYERLVVQGEGLKFVAKDSLACVVDSCSSTSDLRCQGSKFLAELANQYGVGVGCILESCRLVRLSGGVEAAEDFGNGKEGVDFVRDYSKSLYRAPSLSASETAPSLNLLGDFALDALNQDEGQSVRSWEDPLGYDHLAQKHLQTPLTSSELEKRCTGVIRAYRSAIEETGANLLYLAMGFLEWCPTDSDKMVYRAPLLLVPVVMERSRVRGSDALYTFKVAFSNEYLETNLSLAEMLTCNFGLAFPELKEGVFPEAYFSEVADAVSSMSGWRVLREMALGFFSFSKMRLFRDLDESVWPEGCAPLDNPSVVDLLIGCTSDKVVHKLPESNNVGENALCDGAPCPLILPADDSQVLSIRDVLSGSGNMVILGPPGTGKSQTITNMVAGALSQRKSVLFVSEKRAALDVVRKRLDQTGLGDFCLELHSHLTNKGQLHRDLERRLRRECGLVSDYDSKISELEYHRSRLEEYYGVLDELHGESSTSAYSIMAEAERWRLLLNDFDLDDLRFDGGMAMSDVEISIYSERVEGYCQLLSTVSESSSSAWRGYFPTSLLPGDESLVRKGLESSRLAALSIALRWQKLGCQEEVTVTRACHLAASEYATLTMPQQWIQGLAPVLGSEEGRERAFSLVKDVSIYDAACARPGVIRVMNVVDSYSDVSCLSHLIDEIDACGVGALTLSELAEVVNSLDRFESFVPQIDNAVARASELLPHLEGDLSSCDVLHDLAERLQGLPPFVEVHVEAGHAHRLASDYVRDGRNTSLSLSERLNAYSGYFVLCNLPFPARLRSLAHSIENFGLLGRIFSGDYRAAMREVQGFLVDDSAVPDMLALRLVELADLLEEVDTFENDEDLKLVLGKLFIGVESDWDRLDTLVSVAEALVEALGSESVARQFLRDYASRRDQVVEVVDAIRPIITRCRAVRNGLGGEFPDESTSVADNVSLLRQCLETNLSLLEPYRELSDMTVHAVRDAVEETKQAFHLLGSITEEPSYLELFGESLELARNNHKILETMICWVEDVISTTGCEQDFLQWLLAENTANSVSALSEFSLHAAEQMSYYESGLARLKEYGKFDRALWHGESDGECCLNRAVKRIDQALSEIGSLHLISDLRNERERLVDAGLDSVVEFIDGCSPKRGQGMALFRHAAYAGMAREVLRNEPVLRDFQGATYDWDREKMAGLDKELEQLSRERIAALAADCTPPEGNGRGRVCDYTDMYLIRHEISKKRAHIPIRQLVKRSVNALQALKPCFMMSPLSVAQYLSPGDVEFDLIIMDEASQLRLEDALGVILRGKQVVVVGDPKQLPPTSFFDKVHSAEEEETISDTAESVLDTAQNCYPSRCLRWHYRSEDESLIAFSNAQFYDGDLVIIPTPGNSSGRTGLFRHFIEDGCVHGGGGSGVINPVEAIRVAEAVRDHFVRTPEFSLGVAAFNSCQSELIQKEVDRLCAEDHTFEEVLREQEETPSAFFVKNLENVQGDERDVIFISITYGPDRETGKVYQRFGPINSDTGWRRLNVIATRAKKQMHVFTSMHASDVLSNSGSSSQGLIALRNFLEFLETGQIAGGGGVHSDRKPRSGFELAVAHVLKERGWRIAHHVGVAGSFIDIGVYHPDRDEFILGIECDGAGRHLGMSIRGHDILRQQVLEAKGWNIHRIWVTDWVKGRDMEIEKLMTVLDGLSEEKNIFAVQGKEEGFCGECGMSLA